MSAGPKPLTTGRSVIVLAAIALVFVIAVWLTPAGDGEPGVSDACAAWHARWDGAPATAENFINASNALPEGCEP